MKNKKYWNICYSKMHIYAKTVLNWNKRGLKIDTIINRFASDYNLTITGKRNQWLVDLYLTNNNEFLRPLDVTFYHSREWLSLRKKIINAYGTRCMKCKVDNGNCHVDHIKPRSKYPELELSFDNLQVLCESCNCQKSNKNEMDYRLSVFVGQAGCS